MCRHTLTLPSFFLTLRHEPVFFFWFVLDTSIPLCNPFWTVIITLFYGLLRYWSLLSAYWSISGNWCRDAWILTAQGDSGSVSSAIPPIIIYPPFCHSGVLTFKRELVKNQIQFLFCLHWGRTCFHVWFQCVLCPFWLLPAVSRPFSLPDLKPGFLTHMMSEYVPSVLHLILPFPTLLHTTNPAISLGDVIIT